MLFDPGTIERMTLANGMRVLLKPVVGSRVVAIVTLVNAGYFDDTEEHIGLSHVVEHMFYKGSARFPPGELLRRTRTQGGYLDAETSYDTTRYSAVIPAEHFLAALELQADAFRYATAGEEELAREINVIAEEIASKADRPQAHLSEALFELLFDAHPIRRWRLGSATQLRQLRSEHVLEFRRRHYLASRTTLVIAGEFDPDAALRAVTRLYEDMPRASAERAALPREDSRQGMRLREVGSGVRRPHLGIGWRTCDVSHPDAPALDLLSAHLANGPRSALRLKLRARALATDVQASSFTPRGVGAFTLSAHSDAEAWLPSLSAICDVLARCQASLIDADQLAAARSAAEAVWLRPLDRVERVAAFLAQWEALGGWAMGERYFERMIGTTPDQLRAVAAKYMSSDGMSVVLCRPRKEEWRSASLKEIQAATRVLDNTCQGPSSSTSSSAPGRDQGMPKRINQFMLSNGVPLIVLHRPGARTVDIGVFTAESSASEDPSNVGATFLMVRGSLLGTGHRSADAIARAGATLGADIRPTISPECAGWTIHCARAQLRSAIELLADVVVNPLFDDTQLTTERSRAIGRITALRDDALSHAQLRVRHLAFADHPYGLLATGTEQSINRLNQAALQAWHRRAILNGPVTLAVVGDVDAPEVAAIMESHFHRLACGHAKVLDVPSWRSGGVHHVERREQSQSVITFAWPAPRRNDVRRYSMAVLAEIAGGFCGRLFKELRQRRALCYTVQASLSTMLHAGMLTFSLQTSPEKEDEARDALWREADAFSASQVSVDELEEAHGQIIGGLLMGRQSGAALLTQLADCAMFGSIPEFSDLECSYRQVTVESVRATALQFLTRDNEIEVTIRGTG